MSQPDFGVKSLHDAHIVENLDSDKLTEREQAESALEQMGQETADRLLAVLNAEARKFRQERASSRFMVAMYGGITVLLVGLFVIRGLLTGKWNFEEWSNFFLFFMFFGGAGTLAASRPYRNAASKLAELEDVRAVGFLAEMLESNDSAQRQVAASALCKLLPKLRASDTHLLDATQRKILNRVLKKAAFGKDASLALVILQAFQQVGDETALADVERLANLPPQKKKGLQLVVEAAADCLPALKERVERVRASQTLLRPSSASESLSSSSEVLLRPASYSSKTAPEELLRASHVEAAETENERASNRNPVHPENPVNPVYLTVKGGEPS